MSQALGRIDEVLGVGAGVAQVQAVPANRIAVLAKYGMAGKAPLLKDLAEPRKTATVLATVRHLEAAAVDDALDLFDSLMATRLISPARRATDKTRPLADAGAVGHVGRGRRGCGAGCVAAAGVPDVAPLARR
jgi:hypothetical protein